MPKKQLECESKGQKRVTCIFGSFAHLKYQPGRLGIGYGVNGENFLLIAVNKCTRDKSLS